MWKYNLTIFIIGIVCLVLFFYFNSGIIVPSLNLGFSAIDRIPLNLVVFWCFIAGIFYGLLFAIAQEFRLRRRISRLKKENKNIQEELNEIRAETIKETFTDKE